MLVLPVALEKNEVRRTPWVTWGLIASCFVGHVLISTLGAGVEREASRTVGEALQYLGEHPYLTPPTPLPDILGEGGHQALNKLATEWREAGGNPPPGVVESEQEELDRLAEVAGDALRALPSSRLGFVPARPNPWSFVTHTFVHGDWLHLLGNMLFLFLTGPFVEDLYGRPLFTALYVLSGVAGAGAFAAGAGPTEIALVGASGAIAGVMGAFLLRLARHRIEFLVLPIPIIPAFRFKLKLPAFVVIPLWAAEQVYYASVAGRDSPVAFSAHVGGFAFGLLFAGVVALLRIEERFINPAIERQISIEQNPAIERAADARVAGDLVAARRLIDGVVRAEPRNVDAWTESWEIALDAADGEAASQAGLRLLELHGRGPDRDMVWGVVNDPRWRELRMPSRFLSTIADLLARAGDAREAIEVYRRLAAEAPPGDVAALRALVGEGELLARAGDTRGARQAFDRARAHPACSEPWVERMDRALGVSRSTRAGSP